MENKGIFFFLEEVSFLLRHKKKIRNWIKACIISEKSNTGFINYILCSEKYLQRINIEYLNINTFTDVIAFDYSEDKKEISGDIYISIERVKENAKKFGVSVSNELSRVMIHGVLHLIGYKDKTAEDAHQMRNKEDYYLSLLSNFIS